MENNQETHPKRDGELVSDKINFKIEEEDGVRIPNHSLEGVAIKREQDRPGAERGGEQRGEEGGWGPRAPPSTPLPPQCLPADQEEEYRALFSQYSSTLYDVAMEAVTQSLLLEPPLGLGRRLQEEVAGLEAFLHLPSGQHESHLHVLHEGVQLREE